MHRRIKIVVAMVLITGVALLILLLVMRRLHSHNQEGTFAGTLQQSDSSKFRRLPLEFFDDLLTQRLIESALRGDRAGVQSASAAGADLNHHGKQGVTPLIVVLLNFSEQGFEMLLDAGADPNQRADNGDSPLILASLMPNPAYLQSALRHGGRADDADTHGRTPLMLAAARARAGNVRQLLEAGADVNVRDSRGNFPLIFAMQAPQPDQEIVHLLLEHGARVADTNPAGLSARDYAAAFENPALLGWLGNP